MKGGSWLAVLVGVVIAVGLGYASWKLYRISQPEQCYACQRAVHVHSRTIAIDRGKPRVFCCPACALSEHEQEREPVQVTQLTDFVTGSPLAPDGAFLVKGSDVNLCAHAHEMVDADKRPVELQYDRCKPSMLAFGRRVDAAKFVQEHGGQVLPFADVAAQYSR